MKLRPRIRTKTGCLTCRTRRKKCDEVGPVCTGCSRNYLECIWPSGTPARQAPPGQPHFRMGVHIEHIELYRPLSPPEDQKTTSEGSLSSPPPEQGPSPSVNRYTSSPEQQRGYHDATERQSRSSGYVTPYTMSPSPTSSACVAWMEPCSLLLLQHYLEETSTFLVAKPAHYNPYLTLIVPLAYSDDILMHAVLALSGTQLSFKKGRDHHIHLATRRHYSQTLRSLGPLIAEQSVCEDTERALRIALVSLILCYVEVSRRGGQL